MGTPDWKTSYATSYPYAIYEQGRVYCLAWPTKNHVTVDLAKCNNNHAKSDPGDNHVMVLSISNVNVTSDPSQSEFFSRNINQLAGLASNCERDTFEAMASEMPDECHLGLEKHHNGQVDCKGFERSPK